MGARRASSCSPVYLSPAATGGGAGVAAAGGGGAAGAGVLGEQLLSANIAATASRKGACVIFEASALASAGRGYPSHARQGRDRVDSGCRALSALSAGQGPVPPNRRTSRVNCAGEEWSEWQDLNLRPPRPERGALPD